MQIGDITRGRGAWRGIYAVVTESGGITGWRGKRLDAVGLGVPIPVGNDEVVPPTEVPDHVWAKLAELRLRGE